MGASMSLGRQGRGRVPRVWPVLGGGRGYDIRTEGDFDQAMRSALADVGQMSLIHVHLDVNDCSLTLERLAQKLRVRV